MNPRRFLFVIAVTLAFAACESEEFPALPPGPPPSGSLTEDMTAAHNQVRAAAAPVPSPALAPLSWSAEIAATAQAWADGCDFRHNPNLGSLGYGENVAATAPAGSWNGTRAVEVWASEAPFYSHASNTCDTSAANAAGTCRYYTQLVWRSTTTFGCAVRTCTTGSPLPSFPTWDFWVCDYAPAGNVAGQRPY